MHGVAPLSGSSRGPRRRTESHQRLVLASQVLQCCRKMTGETSTETRQLTACGSGEGSADREVPTLAALRTDGLLHERRRVEASE